MHSELLEGISDLGDRLVRYEILPLDRAGECVATLCSADEVELCCRAPPPEGSLDASSEAFSWIVLRDPTSDTSSPRRCLPPFARQVEDGVVFGVALHPQLGFGVCAFQEVRPGTKLRLRLPERDCARFESLESILTHHLPFASLAEQLQFVIF